MSQLSLGSVGRGWKNWAETRENTTLRAPEFRLFTSFHPSVVEASKVRLDSSRPAVVSVTDSAIPDQSNVEIRESLRGAIGGRLKADARCAALLKQLRTKHAEAEGLREKSGDQRQQVKELLAARAADAGTSRRGKSGSGERRANCMDHTILQGMGSAGAVSLCGLPTWEILQVHTSLFFCSHFAKYK